MGGASCCLSWSSSFRREVGALQNTDVSAVDLASGDQRDFIFSSSTFKAAINQADVERVDGPA